MPTATKWIGGAWPGSGIEKPSINPADGEVFGSYQDGGAETAGAAIAAAAKAFLPETRRCDPMLRTLKYVKLRIPQGRSLNRGAK